MVLYSMKGKKGHGSFSPLSALTIGNIDLRSLCLHVNSYMANTFPCQVEGREIGQRVGKYLDYELVENDSERSLQQSNRVSCGMIPKEEVLVGSTM